MPQYSRWGQMQFLRVRQASVAAGRRSGNSSRLCLPEPILAAVVMTVAWEATSNGHDADLAVGSWLGAHAYLRPGEPAQVSWEWVTSRRPASGRGVQSLQDRRVRRDSHQRHCSSGTCAPSATRTASSPERPHWRAGSLVANFSRASRNGPRETSALCATEYGSLLRTLGPRDGR